MDWEPIKATVASTRERGSGQRATWVKKETINFRKMKGLCVRCGNRGHMSSNCQLLPALRPSTRVNMSQLTEEERREIETLAEANVILNDDENEGKVEPL